MGSAPCSGEFCSSELLPDGDRSRQLRLLIDAGSNRYMCMHHAVETLVRLGGRLETQEMNLRTGVYHYVNELVVEAVAQGAPRALLLASLPIASAQCNADALEVVLDHLARGSDPVPVAILGRCLHMFAGSSVAYWRAEDALRTVAVLCRHGADIDFERYASAPLCEAVHHYCATRATILALHGADMHFVPRDPDEVCELIDGMRPLEYADYVASADDSVYAYASATCARSLRAVASARTMLALLMACRRRAVRRRLFLPPEIWHLIAYDHLDTQRLAPPFP